MYTFTAICTDNDRYELSAAMQKDGSYDDLVLTQRFDGEIGFIWDNQEWLIEHLYKQLKLYYANPEYLVDISDEVPEEDYLDLYDLFKAGLELFEL